MIEEYLSTSEFREEQEYFARIYAMEEYHDPEEIASSLDGYDKSPDEIEHDLERLKKSIKETSFDLDYLDDLADEKASYVLEHRYEGFDTLEENKEAIKEVVRQRLLELAEQ